MSEHRTFHMIEAVAGRLEGAPREVRRWSDEFKAQAVAESMEPGASVSAVARRIGIDPSQLFTWRRNARLKAEAVVDTARGESSTADIMIGDAVIRVIARLLRAGELTAVWVPDEGHEAMRDLVRARAAAVATLRVHRQQISAFMLKHGRIYPRKKGWTMRYLCWLQEQQFDHPAHQIALQEMVEAVRVSKERVGRLERVIEEFVPNWSLAPVIRALQTLRGVDLIVAVTFATEVGDVSRFESPRQLMGYLGLVPGERSTGETVRRGSITKAGNGRVRHMLVESAWTYRYPPKVGARKLYRLEEAPPAVRELAWKAQSRLTARYRLLAARGKRTTVVCTAIARELAGFMWAVAREAQEIRT